MGNIGSEVRNLVNKMYRVQNEEEAAWIGTLTDADCIAIAANGVVAQLVEDKIHVEEESTLNMVDYGNDYGYDNCPCGDDNQPMYEDWGVC